MNLRLSMMMCLMILMTACTTKIGANIATDRIITSSDKVEVLGPVSASASPLTDDCTKKSGSRL